VNSLNLTGRLTRDPELRDLPDGRSVCDIRIASDTIGEQPPLYLDLPTFDKQAEACHRYLTKGREIAFSGRLIHREWTTDDGAKHSKHSAVGRVEFLSGGPRSDSELYPDVVDGVEDEGGVPSRLIKTDAGDGRQEGTPWRVFAGSRSGSTTRRSRSRSMTSRGRARGG